MNGEWWFARWSGTISLWLAALIGCGIALLAWFGYRATDEWQRSSALLVDRRADDIADMLTTALGRDMRAVQASVLDGREWTATFVTAPYEVIDVVASAYARYPYPEVFFGWQSDGAAGVFFARSERLPSWLPSAGGGRQYPVEIVTSPAIATRLLTRIEQDTRSRRTHSVFDMDIEGTTYQVIARPVYTAADRESATGGLAILVNLDWVRSHYFSAITSQVARIAGAGEGIVTTIVDDQGRAIPGLPEPRPEEPVKKRTFPVTFFDPMLIALNPPHDLARRTWTVHVSAAGEPTLALAASGARRTLVVIASGAVALALGLLITTRAARAMATVFEMRSDFVSTVTHELKTPVQVIRSIGETISRGRVSSGERLQEYAQLLVQEGHRLSRLIDNLLAYSRVTDVTQLYSFQPEDSGEIVTEALRGFHRLVSDGGFQVQVDMPEERPRVLADRTSIVLAMDNLIDNAMRYSGSSRALDIRVQARDGKVDFSVRDNGEGIAEDELGRVQQRFARGRSHHGHGSGLGLAIVSRIVSDHGGTLRLESVKGAGTTATISLPAVRG